jgi:hypothetical protein
MSGQPRFSLVKVDRHAQRKALCRSLRIRERDGSLSPHSSKAKSTLALVKHASGTCRGRNIYTALEARPLSRRAAKLLDPLTTCALSLPFSGFIVRV